MYARVMHQTKEHSVPHISRSPLTPSHDETQSIYQDKSDENTLLTYIRELRWPKRPRGFNSEKDYGNLFLLEEKRVARKTLKSVVRLG